MPFVKSTDVKLRKRGDELFITIGNFKREMILPVVLAKRRAAGGALRDGMLEIDFLPLEPTEAPTADPVQPGEAESAAAEPSQHEQPA